MAYSSVEYVIRNSAALSLESLSTPSAPTRHLTLPGLAVVREHCELADLWQRGTAASVAGAGVLLASPSDKEQLSQLVHVLSLSIFLYLSLSFSIFLHLSPSFISLS